MVAGSDAARFFGDEDADADRGAKFMAAAADVIKAGFFEIQLRFAHGGRTVGKGTVCAGKCSFQVVDPTGFVVGVDVTAEFAF